MVKLPAGINTISGHSGQSRDAWGPALWDEAPMAKQAERNKAARSLHIARDMWSPLYSVK